MRSANLALRQHKPSTLSVPLRSRFLNSEIVKTADVMDLLLPPSRCVKVGGYLVIFGHTPVLLSAAELRVMSGWELVQSVAGGARWNGLFQYYVCRRLE